MDRCDLIVFCLGELGLHCSLMSRMCEELRLRRDETEICRERGSVLMFSQCLLPDPDSGVAILPVSFVRRILR